MDFDNEVKRLRDKFYEMKKQHYTKVKGENGKSLVNWWALRKAQDAYYNYIQQRVGRYPSIDIHLDNGSYTEPTNPKFYTVKNHPA